MKILGLLLLSAWACEAGVELPLGPFGRPGVPLLVRSAQKTRLEIDDWVFRADGLTQIHLPGLPATLRDASGAGPVRISAPPEGGLLVGLVGDTPPDLRERLGAIVVPIDAGVRLRPGDWRAFELFDRIVVTDPGRAPMAELVTWCRAGGSLVVVGGGVLPAGPLLGSLVQAADLDMALDRAGPAVRARIPRPPAVWPAIYALVRAPEGDSRALHAARWIALGALAAMALQILMGALGLIGRRALFRGLLLLALAGGGLGFLLPRARYRPLAAGRIEVRYFGRGLVLRRVFHVRAGTGPGAEYSPGEFEAPVLYSRNGEPWWRGPERTCPLPEGVVRIFLEERIEEGRPEATLQVGSSAPPTARMLKDRPALGLLAQAAPAGSWRAGARPGAVRLRSGAEREPLLARLDVALQD